MHVSAKIVDSEGQSEKDNQNWKVRMGQAEQDRRLYTEQDWQNSNTCTGPPAQHCQHRSANIRLSTEDCQHGAVSIDWQDRTANTGLLGQDCQDRNDETGMTGQE